MGRSTRSSTTSSERTAEGPPGAGRIIVPALTLALVAAAGWLGYRRGRDGARGERAALAGQVEALDGRLRALERRGQAQLVARVASMQEAVQAAPPAPPAAERPNLKPVRAPPPADDDDLRRYFAAVELRFAGEPREAGWAQPVEDELRRIGEGPGPRLAGVVVEAARCGRGMCRLEIRREPGPEAAATMQELVRRAARVLPQALVENTADPGRVVVYLVREGEPGFPPLVGRSPEASPP
jgi:hypothetical protein